MISRYPRPQLKRDSFICLNGTWDFAITTSETPPASYPDRILVPYPPESHLSGIERRISDSDRLYYRTQFSIEKSFVNSRLLLHFGAVDQVCTVWLNGMCLGSHAGGYLPFSFDITETVRDTNELVVKVIDTLDHLYPWGKQRNDNGGMWYTPFSGIWQTVWIESVPVSYITGIKIDPTLCSVRFQIKGNDDTCFHSKITVFTPSGTVTAETDDDVAEISLPDPVAWTPEEPFLYPVTIQRGEDLVQSYFALRTIGIRTINGIPRITLNEKPYFFHGLLDQGYWKNGICVPDDDSGYENDILFAKSLGFNMLRKHIRIEPELFYEACDRLGMIVFQDFVNNGPHRYWRDTLLPNLGFVREDDTKRKIPHKVHAVFQENMEGACRLLRNHPSICYWTIYNEGWGQYHADDMYEVLKSLDNSRIIDSTSGWFWQKKSDVDSYHLYFTKLKQFGGSRPLVLSEFGGYSYSQDAKRYGYKFFKTQSEYETAVSKLYQDEIIPAVKKGLCAAVYTQISDVEEEKNGLISYDRLDRKISAERMLPISEAVKKAILDPN